MVKKKIKKNIVKTKSLAFKIPESFSALNFNQKIISVVLIVLVIGIISSVFPSDLTGRQTQDDIMKQLGYNTDTNSNSKGSMSPFGGSFGLLNSLLKNVNGVIISFFGIFFKGEAIQIIYLRFVLFILILSIIYYLMKSFGSTNSLINFLVGVSIAYLSIFFIPIGLIATTGILYSSTFMSIVLLIPIMIIWVIFFKLPKTKPGYILRIVFLLIMYYLIVALSNVLLDFGLPIFIDILSVVILLIWIGIPYSAIRAITVKGGEAAETAAISKGIPLLKGTIYDWLGKVAEKMSKKGP